MANSIQDHSHLREGPGTSDTGAIPPAGFQDAFFDSFSGLTEVEGFPDITTFTDDMLGFFPEGF